MRFIISSSPHIKSEETTSKIMFSVFFALIPAGIWGVYKFGIYSLFIILASVLSCVLFEYISQKYIFKTKINISDGSAVLTGLLMAYCLPPSIKLWQICIGSFFAIILSKESFGGIGFNIFNPALIGRTMLWILFPSDMLGVQIDGITQATPLGLLKGNTAVQVSTYLNLFIGNVPGSIGEISKLLLILGALYLFWRKIISWHLPIAYILTVFILSVIFGQDPVLQILSGGLILGAFFMANDYTTSPVFTKGKIVFGFGCGLLTFLIRKFSSFPEGVCYAILIMNLSVPVLDGFNFKNEVLHTKINIRKYVYIFFILTGIYLIAFNFPACRGINLKKSSDKSGIFKEVLPVASDFREQNDCIKGLDENKKIAGYILKIQFDGYSGKVNAVVGVDKEFKITGLKIVEQNETPGLGSKMTEKDFLNQFLGKSHEKILLTSDGGEIDAVTSATVSSRAITDAVREGINDLKKKIE